MREREEETAVRERGGGGIHEEMREARRVRAAHERRGARLWGAQSWDAAGVRGWRWVARPAGRCCRHRDGQCAPQALQPRIDSAATARRSEDEMRVERDGRGLAVATPWRAAKASVRRRC